MLSWLVLSLVAGGVLWSFAAYAVDHHGAVRSSAGPADALVVPGCLVLADGSPSLHLRRRVERAVELYRQGAAPRLILTGGPPGRRVTEAAAAGDLARAMGVPEAAILLEERAASTEQNARYTFEMTAPLRPPVRRLIVVTDSYQVLRATRVFSRYYDEVDANSVLSPPGTRASSALREVVALVYYRSRYGV